MKWLKCNESLPLHFSLPVFDREAGSGRNCLKISTVIQTCIVELTVGPINIILALFSLFNLGVVGFVVHA